MSYHLGMEMEVFNTKLYAINKATHCPTYITANSTLRFVRIFSDNQEAVQRIRTTTLGPSQHLVLYDKHDIVQLQGFKCDWTVGRTIY